MDRLERIYRAMIQTRPQAGANRAVIDVAGLILGATEQPRDDANTFENKILLATFCRYDFSVTAAQREVYDQHKQAAKRRRQLLEEAGVSQEVLDAMKQTERLPYGILGLVDVITDVEMERRFRAHPLFEHPSWRKYCDYMVAFMWVLRYEKAFEQGADPDIQVYEHWRRLMEERYAALME